MGWMVVQSYNQRDLRIMQTRLVELLSQVLERVFERILPVVGFFRLRILRGN